LAKGVIPSINESVVQWLNKRLNLPEAVASWEDEESSRQCFMFSILRDEYDLKRKKLP
jgi:hypothetical protein